MNHERFARWRAGRINDPFRLIFLGWYILAIVAAFSIIF